ncbi:uncharacterized protein LOC143274720 [Babylonia areolata]|uniref:uncharacterized protein LOC143274720 n=1 Tax=Babylonia areolata TaxID=304850 RepID=UPI003FD04993
MAQVLVDKQVLFSGIWRPHHTVDDAFLRKVSRQFLEKPGVKATWRLTTEGLTLVAQRSTEDGRGGGGGGIGGKQQGQTDQIPVQAIKEVTVNRYNPLCLMTIYVDSARRFNALVCRCQSEQDTAHIVQVFRRLQKSLSGEGYRIDLKQPQGINWTLKTKENGERKDDEDDDVDDLNKNGDREAAEVAYTQHHHHHHHHNNNNNSNSEVVVVEVEEETLEREAMDVEGRPCFNVGVQADLGAGDEDTVSITSEMSYQSLKEELDTLSNEVRDIKILLEQTTGISAEEFFKRRRDPTASILVPVKRSHSEEESEGGGVVGMRMGTGSGRPSALGGNGGEKSVNFANVPAYKDDDEEMDFDIRSVGMQTTASSSYHSSSKRGGGKYLKRVRQALTPNRYQNQRTRSESSSSSSSSPSPMSPQSPTFSSHPGKRAGGGGGGGEGGSSSPSVFFASPTSPTYWGSGRDRFTALSLSRSSVYSSGGGGGTVVRPIEAVYSAHTPGFRQKRRQVVVLPARSASMPRQRWRPPPSSPSPSSGGGGGGPLSPASRKVQAPGNPSGTAAQNGAS